MDDEDKNAVSPFVQEERFGINGSSRYISYPIVLYNDTTADESGGVNVFSTSFLISKDEREVKRSDGLVSYDEIDKAIQSHLEPNKRSAH